MWRQKEALTLAESYFRKDEKYLFVEVLPWYYFFSLRFLMVLVGFLVSTVLGALLLKNIPAVGYAAYLLFGGGIVYYAVTRSVYPNYMVISQMSVYRFILKSIRQFDEIPVCKIGKVDIRPLSFSRKRAILTIQCSKEYVHSHPERRRQYELRHAQQNPEKVNPRFLASRKATRLRVVIRNPKDYYTVFNELKQMLDYSYSISAERIIECSRKDNLKKQK